MNPSNTYSPDLFYPPMEHSGYPPSSIPPSQPHNDYGFLFMMGTPNGHNSPMPYGMSSCPPRASQYGYHQHSESYANSSPIPTPMQSYPNNSTSSSNRSSTYGFTPSPYSHSSSHPHMLQNPPSYYKSSILFGPRLNQMSAPSPPIPIHPSQSLFNNHQLPASHVNGPSPLLLSDFIPRDILNPKGDGQSTSGSSSRQRSVSRNADLERPPGISLPGDIRESSNEPPPTKEKHQDVTSPMHETFSSGTLTAENIEDEISQAVSREPKPFQDVADEFEKYAPKSEEENPTGEHTILSGRKIQHRLLTKQEIKRNVRTSWNSLLLKGGIKNIAPAVFQMKHLVNLYICGNQLSTLSPLISNLDSLEILDLSNNVLTSLPAKIGDLTKLKQLYLENNLLSTLPSDLSKLFCLEIIDLTNNPLRPELAAAYKNGGEEGKEGILTYLMKELISENAAPIRPWIDARKGGMKDVKEKQPNFTVMCYNILSDSYATPQAHSLCPPWALNWKYRSLCIFQDLNRYCADIFALQELQDEQYYSLFKAYFEDKGYASTFYPKTRSTTMSEKRTKKC